MRNIVHVVFGDYSGGTLERSFEFDENLRGEIICFNDDLRAGSIRDLHRKEERESRQDWWSLIIPDGLKHITDDYNKVEIIRECLKDRKQIIIWLGSDGFNRLGFARLCFSLTTLLINCSVVAISEGQITNKVGENYRPASLIVMDPDQIAHLAIHLRPISKSEIEEGVNLWKRLSGQNSIIRSLINNKQVESRDESFYDADLLSRCTTNFQKAARVIGYTLCDIDFEVSDSILNWRLQELVKQKKLEAKGVLVEIRDYKVKLVAGLSSDALQ